MKYVDPNGQIHEKAWDFISAMARIKFESLIGENNVIAMNETQTVQHRIQLPEINKSDNPELTRIEIDKDNNRLIAFDQYGNRIGESTIDYDVQQLADQISHTLIVRDVHPLRNINLTIESMNKPTVETVNEAPEASIDNNPPSLG